jgi:hypothetical protein
MSLISSAVSAVATPIKPYLLAIKIAAIAGAASLIVFLSWRVHVDGQQIGSLKETVLQARADNVSDMTTINQLKTANEQWATQLAVNQEKIDELTQQLSDQQHDLSVARNNVAAAQESENTSADIGLRSVRIDGVDDQLAQRLRSESLSNAH